MLIKAENSENKLRFTRDKKTGLVIEEKQGKYTVNRTYDNEGNCTHITSNLGADIRHTYDREGNLQTMQAGENWQASWVRDNTGLEIQRTFSGNVIVKTERDRFGREIHKSVRTNNIERGAYRYEWGIANRLLSKENELTGTIMRYDYDRFDFLIRQDITKGSETDIIYRMPDFVGNLYGTPERKDRKYGTGGRLLEDEECIYHYDDEGNLVFREFRQPRKDAIKHDRKRMEREYGIRRQVTDMGWLYEWTSSGMLRRVIRPNGSPVEFRYDALGRRTAKRYLGKVTRWVWDGNTPLHEWVAAAKDNDGQEESSCPDGNSLTTWVFEEGTFVPAAKIQGDRQCSIVSDYLGTPVQMYDNEGKRIWDCTLDIYGKVADFRGESLYDCPFRFQGQYEDAETGLYYNRFRYYDANWGGYISQDPIGLLGGNPTYYSYVYDNNSLTDILGLSCTKELKKNMRKAQKELEKKGITNRAWHKEKGSAAHHIVAGDDIRAQQARDILKHYNIDINSAENGIYLKHIDPNSKQSGAYHRIIHTDQYYTTVNERIMEASMYGGRTEVLNELKRLQEDLLFNRKIW